MTVYTPSQLHPYLTTILNLPHPSPSAPQHPSLPALTTLLTAHLLHVPFENFDLHYTPHRRLSLDPTDLYEKIVTRRRGGYCMEVNAFFAAVLRGLGYHVVSVGAKVSLATGGGGEGFLGYNHQLSLVTIPNHPHPYAVDVGFGADTPTQPLPLIPSLITRGWHPTSTMKLTRSALPGGADPTPRFWVYEHSRNYGVDGEGQEVEGTKWTPGYAFTEVEFTREDYEVMNVGTMEGVRSLFTRTVVGARFAGWEELVEWGVVKREADGEVVERYGGLVGQVTLMGGVVKVKVRGMVVREVKLGSEEERGEALGRYFGVWLTERGEGNIKGLVSHLK